MELSNIPNTGLFNRIASLINENFDKIRQRFLEVGDASASANAAAVSAAQAAQSLATIQNEIASLDTSQSTEAEIAALNAKIAVNKAGIEGIEERIGGGAEPYSLDSLVNQGYINTNGNVVSSTLSGYTNPIPISVGDIVTVTGIGTNTACICYTESSSTGQTSFEVCAHSSSSSTTSDNFSWIADKDGYVVLCGRLDSFSASIQGYDKVERADEIAESVREDFDAIHEKVTNEDFVYATIDAEGKLLQGIKRDGTTYLHSIESPTTKILEGLEYKIPSIEENPEYLMATIDPDGKVLQGLRGNGTSFFHALDSPTLDKLEQQIRAAGSDTSATVDMLVDYLRIFCYVANAPIGTRIFTSDGVNVGDEFFVKFVGQAVAANLSLYDENGTRLTWYGYYSRSAGTVYTGKIIIPTGFSYAAIGWGKVTDLLISQMDIDAIAGMTDTVAELNNGDIPIKSYFVDEMRTTINTIDSLTKKPSLVFPILTDSHMGTSARGQEWCQETVNNVRHLCAHCYCDGVIHLGDILNVGWYSKFIDDGNTEAEANVKVYSLMQDYLLRYATANKHLFAVNGNHDGLRANVFVADRWYGMIGRMMQDDSKVVGYGQEPYFYADFPKVNVRCIFLSQPESYSNGAGLTYGWSQTQLNWFANTALNITDGYHVILFSHIAPFQATYIPNGKLPNRDTFYGICNAFNSHTNYSDSVATCDFSHLVTSKIILEIVGHTHGQWEYASGESYDQPNVVVDGVEQTWTYTNGMPCTVAILTNTYLSETVGSQIIDGQPVRDGDCGTYHVPRTDKTVTQDAWDTLVYRPDLKKVFLVRFGSGEDREIDLSDII